MSSKNDLDGGHIKPAQLLQQKKINLNYSKAIQNKSFDDTE